MDILDGRLLVYYTVSFPEPARAHVLARQLDTSLTTLRATNPDLDVVMFCHGTVPDLVARIARRHHTRLVELPDPVVRLRADIGPLGGIIGRFAPVHKFLVLQELAEVAPVDALYLDADTIVLGDLTTLVPDDDGRRRLLAREEVQSRRCRFGPDRDYLDEGELARSVTAAGGTAPAPAFNTGVMLSHRFPWDRARAFERRYLSWLVRFAIWMADHPADPATPQYADVFDLASLRRLLTGPNAGRVRRLGVRYPSTNRWLAEEAAAWVAVGHERDVTVSHFRPDHVAQGGEPLDGSLPRTVWHYFTSNQSGMEQRIHLHRATRRFVPPHPAQPRQH